MRVFLFAVLLAFPALAIEKGGPLWVSVKEAPLRSQPKEGAKKLATLRAGTQVVWEGPDTKDRQFQRVTAGGKSGWVLVSELSPSKPQPEIGVGGKQVVPFAAQGYVKCDMGSTARMVDPRHADTQRALESIEALNAKAATPEAIEKKRRELSQTR